MTCRLCNSSNIYEVFNIKNTLVDGVYSANKKEISDFTLLKCNMCGLYQLKEIVNYHEIYSNYKFSSTAIGVISEWMNDLYNILTRNYDIDGKTILEIGASDGCFLNLFKLKNNIYGIEPSSGLTNIAQHKYGINIVNGYYDKKSFSDKKFDLVICRHVIEHIEDIRVFIDDMTNNLTNEGLLYLEIPDMDQIINNLNYTNFFHEHVNYFSKEVLDKYMLSLGFENIFYIKNKVHNGSFGVIYKRKISNSLSYLNNKIEQDRLLLTKALSSYKNVAGYGAANKTFKLLSIFNLDNKINIIFDNNQNLWGSHIVSKKNIAIVSPKKIIDSNYDAIIVFATSYTDEVIKYLKNDLHFIGDIILIYPNIKIIKHL